MLHVLCRQCSGTCDTECNTASGYAAIGTFNWWLAAIMCGMTSLDEKRTQLHCCRVLWPILVWSRTARPSGKLCPMTFDSSASPSERADYEPACIRRNGATLRSVHNKARRVGQRLALHAASMSAACRCISRGVRQTSSNQTEQTRKSSATASSVVAAVRLN